MSEATDNTTQTQTTEDSTPIDFTTVAVTPLQSTWAFWYDDHRNTQPDYEKYQQSLQCLGDFNTIEDFWRHFSYINKPDAYPRECSLFLVRGGQKVTPAWESFPDGGCWILRVRKRNNLIDRLWEELVFACVGELFEMPDIVCVGVSTRPREDVLSIWNNDNTTHAARFMIGDKLRQILNLDDSTVVEYKTFRSAIKDNSSFKNAKNYAYNPAAALQPPIDIPPVFVEIPATATAQSESK